MAISKTPYRLVIFISAKLWNLCRSLSAYLYVYINKLPDYYVMSPTHPDHIESNGTPEHDEDDLSDAGPYLALACYVPSTVFDCFREKKAGLFTFAWRRR